MTNAPETYIIMKSPGFPLGCEPTKAVAVKRGREIGGYVVDTRCGEVIHPKPRMPHKQFARAHS